MVEQFFISLIFFFYYTIFRPQNWVVTTVTKPLDAVVLYG
jgi:hypothetical protein